MSIAYYYGLECETLVKKHLKEQGYTILETRFKTPYGEIDIVAQKSKLIVFIEVKARKKLRHHEVLTQQQIKRISQAACFYISSKLTLEQESRFDFILVEGYKIISHLKGAWEAE